MLSPPKPPKTTGQPFLLSETPEPGTPGDAPQA
jgi:hypothetical protein